MTKLLIVALAIVPTAAYAVLLMAHALLVWRHRTSEHRDVLLIDLAMVFAYGALTGFYLISEALDA
jgi:hypothetical protein